MKILIFAPILALAAGFVEARVPAEFQYKELADRYPSRQDGVIDSINRTGIIEITVRFAGGAKKTYTILTGSEVRNRRHLPIPVSEVRAGDRVVVYENAAEKTFVIVAQ